MSLLDMERALKLNPANLEIVLGILQQVAGTDGSGGVGGAVPVYERLPVLTNFSDGYVGLSFVPTNGSHIQVFIENDSDEVSSIQFSTTEFTLVRSSVGGAYNRIVWDSTKTSNGGVGTPIPDADPAPTKGMEDIMQSSFHLHIYYLR